MTMDPQSPTRPPTPSESYLPVPGALLYCREIGSATRPYIEGDIQTEAQYYRAHFSAALRRAEDVDRVVARLRSHFTPQDIVKARAIEERLYDQTWRVPEYDLLEKLRQRTGPTLVIHGAQDFCPVACASNIADAVPGARLVVIDDCGHFAYLERPMDVLKAIEAFVQPC